MSRMIAQPNHDDASNPIAVEDCPVCDLTDARACPACNATGLFVVRASAGHPTDASR